MKTFTTKVQKPMLEISYYEGATNPREWDNVALFVLRRGFGDSKDSYYNTILEETSSNSNNVEEHEVNFVKAFEDYTNQTVVYSTAITKYEHSGIRLMQGVYTGWDYGVIGFAVITEERLEALGVGHRDFERIMDSELDELNAYINGDVYHYRLFDEDGNEIDSCGGYYSLDDIKEELGEEWQDEDMSEYMVY